MASAEAAITASGEFTEWVQATEASNEGSISISGTFAGTLAVERGRESQGVIVPQELPTTYTAPVEANFGATTDSFYRIICTAYTSGTADVEIAV